jgi:hypothetical protein
MFLMFLEGSVKSSSVVFVLLIKHFLNPLPFIRGSSIIMFGFSAILAVIGIALIISSLLKKPTFKIHIVGRKSITISSKLEEIFIIVRKYEEK